MAEVWILYIKSITRRGNSDAPRKDEIEINKTILRPVSKFLIPN